MVHSIVALAGLVAAFFVLYKYVIPRLFPNVVHRVGIIRFDDGSDTVFAFESSGMPLANNYNRSQAKANVRRRNHQYEAAQA